MMQFADVPLKTPNNAFAKSQFEKFELQFQKKLKELEESATQSTAKIMSGHKQSQPIDVTGASDSDASVSHM